MSRVRLTLVRSDMGDGGWSLHAHRLDAGPKADPQDEWPLVLSGPGRMVKGEWARPAERLWARARRVASERARELGYSLELIGGAS